MTTAFVTVFKIYYRIFLYRQLSFGLTFRKSSRYVLIYFWEKSMNAQNESLLKELNGTVKLGELFCGPGGIGLGAFLAHADGLKIDHIWATDYDKDTCKTYRNNLHPKEIICEDIRKLDFEKILQKHGDIDCLTFGFPCNDFSIVGEQ